MFLKYRITGRPLKKAKIHASISLEAMSLNKIRAYKFETPTNTTIELDSGDVLDFRFEYRLTAQQFNDTLIYNDLFPKKLKTIC